MTLDQIISHGYRVRMKEPHPNAGSSLTYANRPMRIGSSIAQQGDFYLEGLASVVVPHEFLREHPEQWEDAGHRWYRMVYEYPTAVYVSRFFLRSLKGANTVWAVVPFILKPKLLRAPEQYTLESIERENLLVEHNRVPNISKDLAFMRVQEMPVGTIVESL